MKPLRLVDRPCSGGCGVVFTGCNADDTAKVTCLACAGLAPQDPAENGSRP